MNGPKRGQTWEQYIRWYYAEMPAMAEHLIATRSKKK